MKHVFFSFLFLFASSAMAADQTCLNEALDLLQKRDPNGYKIYQEAKDPDYFANWLKCGDRSESVAGKLPAAVHETLHKVDLDQRGKLKRDRFYFYLPGGKLISVATYDELFNRDQLALELAAEEKNDRYFKTYLAGQSGRQKLPMLIEELNAYTHDLLTAIALVDLQPKNQRSSDRDGPITFLYYLELYLRHARAKYPDAWNVLVGDREYVEVLRQLWNNAESALALACGHVGLGLGDSFVVKKVYDARNLEALNALFIQAKVAPLVLHPIAGCAGWKQQKQLIGRKTSTSGFSFTTITIDGKNYTIEEIRELAKTDPVMQAVLKALESGTAN